MAVAAKPAESPYQSIITRNAFGLRPPPPPTPPPEPVPQVTPSALKLTGITTLFAGKRAMFVLQEPNKPQLISDLVREGERDSVITNLEVINIDERAGVVRVVYGGKELSLNFLDNGLKAPAAPAVPAPGPGQAGRPGAIPAVATVPGARLGAPGPSAASAASPTVLQRVGGAPSASSVVQSASGMRTIPTRPTRLPSSGGTWVVAPGSVISQVPRIAQPAVSPEQQAQNMRLQEELLRRYGITIPTPPPLPGADVVTDPAGAGNIPPAPVPTP